MGSAEFLATCQSMVADYTNRHLDVTDENPGIRPEDTYVVWYAKTLQNHKALLSTPLPDGMYYELTYNGDKEEIYFDAYKKFENLKLTKTKEGVEA